MHGALRAPRTCTARHGQFLRRNFDLALPLTLTLAETELAVQPMEIVPEYPWSTSLNRQA